MANLFNPERKSRLDNPERAQWQKPDEVIAHLDLLPGATVIDIGAGTGYFSFRMAEAAGPGGKIYAVDRQQEMLDTIRGRVAEKNTPNVIPTPSSAEKTDLPDGIADLVFTANVTHEYDDLNAGFLEHARLLKPGGRLVVIDWKLAETPIGPPADHRLPLDRIVQAARQAGLDSTRESDLLPHQYFLFFTRK